MERTPSGRHELAEPEPSTRRILGIASEIRAMNQDRPASILPFSGTLADLPMHAVRVVPKECTLADASRYFASHDIEYVVVQDKRVPIGVVHRFDLVGRGDRSFDAEAPVTSLMNTRVVSAQKEESVSESLSFMIKHDLGFLLIMDDKTVMGIVDQADWVSLRGLLPTGLLHDIQNADTLAQVVALRERAHQVVWEEFGTERSATALTSVVTTIHDTMTRRVLTLALADMAKDGRGQPPCAFAWIGMGSEGRRAQTIVTDQDNGLIFQAPTGIDEREVDDWFAELAERVVAGLASCGFRRCAGNVMATNPELRGSEAHWRALFDRIVTESGDKELFEASIYFDFRCLFGKSQLVEDLRAHLHRAIAGHDFFLRHLVETTVQGSGPPLGTWRWKVYAFTGIAPPPFDLKKSAIVPLDAAVRVLALRARIDETNTLARLQRCLEQGHISKALADEVRTAFEFLLRQRLLIEFAATSADESHDHLIDLGALPPHRARYLVDALRAVRHLQEYVYELVAGKKIHWSTR